LAIVWDKKFEVGHERIDFEHRIFLGLIVDLDNEVRLRSRPERQLRILREIRLYAEFHFVSEENIMADCEYPDLASHRDAHHYLLAALSNRIFSPSDDAQAGQSNVDFLLDWFAIHTTQEDKKVAQYIRQSH
jgi:hemerythrin